MYDNLRPPPPPRPPKKSGSGCWKIVFILFLVLMVPLILRRLNSIGVIELPLLSDSVGVVRIEGPITDSRRINTIIREFGENKKIRAVVVRLDTPGGAVGASEEIYREVVRLREKDKKPVVVSMGNLAASGGYYISCGADEIYANAGTLTGSIGVIAMDFNLESILRRVGVSPVVLKSGEHKDTGSPFREMTPEDRRLIQGVIYDTYRQFVRAVLQARHKEIEGILLKRPGQIADVLSTSTTNKPGSGLEWDAFTTGSIAAETGATTASEIALHTMADGRVFSGEQALKLGLVDKIGTLYDAIDRAAQLGGISKKPHVVYRSPSSGISEVLGSSMREMWQVFSRSEPAVQYRGGE